MLAIFRIFLLNLLILDINNAYSNPVFDTIPGQENNVESMINNFFKENNNDDNNNSQEKKNTSIDINAIISQMQTKISELESKIPNDLKNKKITYTDNQELINNQPKIIDNNFNLINKTCEKLNKTISDNMLNNTINIDLFDLIKAIILSCNSYENTKKIIENSLESLEALTESHQKNINNFQKIILYRYAISIALLTPNNILSSVINFKHTDFIQQQKIIEILESFLGNISVFTPEDYIQTIRNLLSTIIKKTQEKQLIPSEFIFVIANVICNSISQEVKIFESTSRETLRSLENLTNEIKSLLKELEHTLISESTAPNLKTPIDRNIKLISSTIEIISKINKSLIENNEKLIRNTKEIIKTLNIFEKYEADPKIQDEIQKLNTNNQKLIKN